ncbi:hypothetical protein D917_10339, partial [Trichinella nativa]
GIDCDDPLPPEASAQGQTWKEVLPGLSMIVAERALVQVSVEDITRMELHGFVYACGKAYGVVYLRLTHSDGRVEVHLVVAT